MIPNNSTLARIVYNNQPYTLIEGRNTIGRRATMPQAQIQIPTDDRYMSRLHAAIDVVPAVGGGYLYHLVPLTQSSSIYVNDQPLQPNCSAVLNIGDTITLGRTKIELQRVVIYK